MGKIIALANQKGGVAKTTSTYNIGVSLSRKGYKTLLVDLDSQASLTISAGLEPYDFEFGIVSLLQKKPVFDKSKIKSLNDNLDIITSRIELAHLEMELISRPVRETILTRVLSNFQDDYDYILIDCPPQLSMLTINAFAAADYILIPCKTDYLSYRGLEQLLNSIAEIKELVNPKLQILGVIATMYEQRINDDKEILEALQKENNVIAIIKKMAIAKKGVYDGRSVADQDVNNPIAKEYDKISEYIIEKVGL